MDIPPAGTMVGDSVVLAREPPADPSEPEVLAYAEWMGIGRPPGGPGAFGRWTRWKEGVELLGCLSLERWVGIYTRRVLCSPKT